MTQTLVQPQPTEAEIALWADADTLAYAMWTRIRRQLLSGEEIDPFYLNMACGMATFALDLAYHFRCGVGRG